jgi:hypothetical protein
MDWGVCGGFSKSFPLLEKKVKKGIKKTALIADSCWKRVGTDRLEAKKGRNLKLESFLPSLFCVMFGKKSKIKWIGKRGFGQFRNFKPSNFFIPFFLHFSLERVKGNNFKREMGYSLFFWSIALYSN